MTPPGEPPAGGGGFPATQPEQNYPPAWIKLVRGGNVIPARRWGRVGEGALADNIKHHQRQNAVAIAIPSLPCIQT